MFVELSYGLDVRLLSKLSDSEGHEGGVIRSRHGPIVESKGETCGVGSLR